MIGNPDFPEFGPTGNAGDITVKGLASPAQSILIDGAYAPPVLSCCLHDQLTGGRERIIFCAHPLLAEDYQEAYSLRLFER